MSEMQMDRVPIFSCSTSLFIEPTFYCVGPLDDCQQCFYNKDLEIIMLNQFCVHRWRTIIPL